MFPTWRDIEVQSDLRKARMQEAAEWHMANQLKGSGGGGLSPYAETLVRLGTWMVNTGVQLRSRYGYVSTSENSMRSIEQGC